MKFLRKDTRSRQMSSIHKKHLRPQRIDAKGIEVSVYLLFRRSGSLQLDIPIRTILICCYQLW